MKRFIGYRPTPPQWQIDQGITAPQGEPSYEGVVFSDGSVAIRWRGAHVSTAVWGSWEDVYKVHGHPEYGTVIEWPDGEP